MSIGGYADDGDLRRRIDDLEDRMEHLEAMLLDESDAAELRWAAESHAASADAAESSFAVATAPEPRTLDTAHGSQPADDGRRDHEAEPSVPPSRNLPTLPAASPVPSTPPKAPLFDLGEIEERLAGRALALVGGAALLLGAVFFLSLAFSRGWIGPEMQVALGLLGGAAGMLAGAVLLFRGDRLVGHVLVAVGLAVISLSLFAATSLYELTEPVVALAGSFAAAAVATVIAIRSRSQIVAGFGLVAVLAAPPIMGAEPDLVTVAYMALALAGVAAISLWQTWSWLPPIAFVLSVPQLYEWIAGQPDLALGVPALLLYWAVITVAAGGEAFRLARHELSVTSAPLFLAVGAATIGLSTQVLETNEQQAAFLLGLALLHGLVTALFARRRGTLDPFGLLAGAYGIAMASAAVPLLLGATLTSVVWAAEAAALGIFAGRRAHGPALIAAGALYAIASARLALEAVQAGPLGSVDDLGVSAVGVATVGVATGSVETILAGFAFLLGVGLVLMVFVPLRACRSLVVGAVAGVAMPVAYLALDDVALVSAWVAIALLAIGLPRWLSRLPERRIPWRLGPSLAWLRPTVPTAPLASLVPQAAGTGAMLLATLGTIDAVIAQPGLPGIPFGDQAGLSALVLAAGFASVGALLGGPANLRRGLVAAGLTVGIVAITQFEAPWYVMVWAALAVGAAAMSRLDDGGMVSYRRVALVALAVLAGLALFEAPPTRLVVDRAGVEPHPFLVSGATLALGMLALALGAVAAIGRHWPRRVVATLAALAGATALYLLSVGVVDVFAGEVATLGSRAWTRIDELTKEAQVALSVVWTSTGVVVLAAGLLLRRANLRMAGLAVLALATVKVFLVDLSALDVAYRVITLIVLGALLVASAAAWNRMKPGGTAGQGGIGQRPADASSGH